MRPTVRSATALSVALAMTLASSTLAWADARVDGSRGPALAQAPRLGDAKALASVRVDDSSTRAKLLRAQLDAIETAVDLCNEDPTKGAEYLKRNLEALYSFAPEISEKAQLQTIQRNAILALARAYQNSGRTSKAKAVLNDLYRFDPPRTTELQALGPTLQGLGEEEKKAVANLGRGRINVKCSGPCEVFVNERAVGKRSEHRQGEYRVYVVDLSKQKPPMQKSVEIHQAGAEVQVRYRNQAHIHTDGTPNGMPSENGADPLMFVDPSQTVLQERRPDGQPAGRARADRLAPLWAEVTGTMVGLAAIGTGVGLHIAHGKCASEGNYPDPVTNETMFGCTEKYDTALAGTITLVSGLVVAVGFGVLWAVDSRYVRKQQERSGGRLSRHWDGPLKFRF